MTISYKFEDFAEQLTKKGHDLDLDTLKIALTNVLPVANQTSFDPVTLHAAPANANGYTAGGYDILNSISEVGGVATLSGTDITITANGGSIGPFQYMVLYNDTHVNDGLIHFYDHESEVTLADSESFTFDLLTNISTFQ